MIRPVEWRNGAVVLLDQRLLPMQEVYRVYRDHREVARAIKDMVIRGAPAIGVAAAMGIALGVAQASDARPARATFERICRTLRGDAADGRQSLLGHRAHARASSRARADAAREVMREILRREALRDPRRGHRRQPRPRRARRGADRGRARPSSRTATPARWRRPATARRSASSAPPSRPASGSASIASETRPFLQGARLTAWELKKERIPVTLITDSMVGHFMQARRDRLRRSSAPTAPPPTATSPTRSAPTRVAVLAHATASRSTSPRRPRPIDLACPNGDADPDRGARQRAR